MVHTGCMDLSRPLATLLPAAEAGALTVLAGTEAPLTGRSIAELAGERSHPSTLRALNRLVEQGLVSVQSAGRANLYRLNRDHLMAPAVIELTRSGERLRDHLVETITSWETPCLLAALYGSVARGQAGPASDIDLLVVRPEVLTPTQQQTWDAQLVELETAVNASTGNHLSWLETTLPDLRRAQAAGEPIFQSWRDDAIRLVGTPLTRLLLEYDRTVRAS